MPAKVTTADISGRDVLALGLKSRLLLVKDLVSGQSEIYKVKNIPVQVAFQKVSPQFNSLRGGNSTVNASLLEKVQQRETAS